jgi:Tfp pilus assembly protein PilF
VLDGTEVAAPPAPGASTPVFVATFASLLALILVFLFLDLALGRMDRNESAMHAAQLFEDGRRLLAAGNARDAGERFASALASQRNNTAYALGLAESMMVEGRNDDAEQTLTDALDRAANDGAVNLQMARLLERTGRRGESTVYYHRAIFGRWDADSTQQRIQARFELVDALARRKDGGAMLAELLPLQATLPDSPAISRRLAHLFLEAGSPRRAMDIFRDFIRRDARDADAYTGMAEAALALGNFATARADFLEASHLEPDNASISARSAVADTLLTLDPDARRLDERERVGRAQALLGRAIAERERCLGSPFVGPAADSARLQMVATSALATPERTEAVTRLAASIWSTRPPRCVSPFAADEVLATVMRSLEP